MKEDEIHTVCRNNYALGLCSSQSPCCCQQGEEEAAEISVRLAIIEAAHERSEAKPFLISSRITLQAAAGL